MSRNSKTTLAGTNNLKPVNNPLSPLPDFRHKALRILLTPDERKFVQQRLEKLVNKFQSITVSEHLFVPPNKNTEKALRSLLKHLSAVCDIVNPKSQLLLFVDDQDNDHIRGLIQGFPTVSKMMYRLVEETINSKKYYRKETAAKIPTDIACEVARLLEDYEIKPTITTKGVWDELTRYVLLHGCGRDETDANIKNILNKAKFITRKQLDSPSSPEDRWSGINPRVSVCTDCPHQFNMMPYSMKDPRFIFRQKRGRK
jgi:hypothetical protein